MGKHRIYIKTFGCQMNKNDSDVIRELVSSAGYEAAQDPSDADVYLVNTCSVRAHAEKRALGHITSLKKWRTASEQRVLGVIGCMAQKMGVDIAVTCPYVDLVLGPDSYAQIRRHIESAFARRTKIIDTKLSDTTYCGIHHKPRGIADFVSIMRGCDNFCSYCVVPFVRGRARSRPAEDIITETAGLVAGGVKDVTLLGQNVNEYSYSDIGFGDLLSMVAERTDVFRLRFLTSHPKDLKPSIIGAVRGHRNVCDWFHLPLQSGCDRILSLMNRCYTAAEYVDLVARIRDALPEATVTTDIIAGFPTETDAEFGQTLALLEEIRFDNMYMYYYSPREGTEAAKLAMLPEEKRKARLQTLIDLQNRIFAEKMNEMVGRTCEVLFESGSASGGTRGKTRGNADVIVQEKIAPGEVRQVQIVKVRGITPIGEVLPCQGADPAASARR
jgi:tRNA-2-methylthio-N6-dimethylallyladenosine synthase